MNILPVNQSPAAPAVLAAAIDAIDEGAEIAGSDPTSGSSSVIEPASIVDLSAAAQLLSNITQANAAASQDASQIASQEDIVELLAESQSALVQSASALPFAALTAEEEALINAALHSGLTNSALNEALAATGVASENLSTGAVPVAPAATAPVAPALPTPAAVTAASPAPAATATAPTTVATPPATAGVALAPPIAVSSAAAAIDEDAIAMAAPAVAAAVAAYRLNEDFAVEHATAESDAPASPEADSDVAPTTSVDAAVLDLHNSPRDDAGHGIAWNWTSMVRRLVRK